jgi:hypothetical protein
MTIKVELSIEQVADILKSMKKGELETLEFLLDSETEREILERRKEARSGDTIPIDKLKSFMDL